RGLGWHAGNSDFGFRQRIALMEGYSETKKQTGMAHWSVCQVLSTRAHLIRSEIERNGRGTFLPTFASVRYVDGKRSASERQLLPGYLFVRTEVLQDFYDDYGVKIARTIGRIAGMDEVALARLVVGHATGAFNEV